MSAVTDLSPRAGATRLGRLSAARARWCGTRTSARQRLRAFGGLPLLIVVGASRSEVAALMPPGAGPAAWRCDDALATPVAGGALLTFADCLLADALWKTRWQATLHRLAADRATCPADGLLVVLGMDLFMGPTALDFDALTALGGQLREAVEMAQQIGGWRLPVHLLLSRADALAGFGALAAALPAALHGGPFGWAPPADSGARLRKGWVGAALQALAAQVDALIAQWPAQADGRPQEARQLPSALQALAPPLSSMLVALVGQGAEQQDLMFRGLYLSGRATSGGGHPFGDELFARRLPAERFFPERALVRPGVATVQARQRGLRAAKTACVGAVVLLAASVLALWQRQEAVNGVHRLATQVGATLQSLPAGSVPDPTGAVSERLFAQMTPVSIDRLETPWAPLSFASRSDSHAVDALLGTAYDKVVLPALHDRLSRDIATLLGDDASSAVTTPVPTVPRMTAERCATDAATPADATALRALADRLDLYQRHAAVYQTLSSHPDVQAFGGLIRFALRLDPPAGLGGAPGFYRTALSTSTAPPLDARAIRVQMYGIVRSHFASGLAGAYPASTLAGAVAEVAAAADVQDDATPAAQSLSRLDHALHTLQATASTADNGWLAGTAQAPAIKAFLDRVAKLSVDAVPALPLLDADVIEDLRRQAAACRDSVRSQVLEARAPGDRPILSTSGGAVALSPDLARWIPVLDAFLAQPLMAFTAAEVPPDDATRTAPDEGQLRWDLLDLQSVQSAAAGYAAFLSKTPPDSVPAALFQQMRVAAGDQLDLLIAATIARARQPATDAPPPTDDATLRTDIARFADAAPVLASLLASLKQAGRDDSASQLDTLLADQATGLLRQVSTLLATTNPYRMANASLSFWNGSPPLAAPAFGADSASALAASLPGRRAYVQALSHDDAAPLLAYLQQSATAATPGRSSLVAQWQAIAVQLARYDHGDTGNSVARLEQFIESGMDAITLANCDQATQAAAGGTDWFATTQQALGSTVDRRCHGALAGDTTRQYALMATAFNRNLALHFPFGPPSAPDADPGDVKRFFDRFGAGLPALRAGFASLPSDDQVGPLPFLDQLIAVQAALAPMLATPLSDTPLSYDVTVKFRTNAGLDPGADQLVEETLVFGTQSLSSFATAKSLSWAGGQPVALRLTWAANAPNLPVAGVDGLPTVTGATAQYRYAGAWALLRLLASQHPAPATWVQLADRGAETIGLQPTLKPNPAAVPGGDVALKSARIFMQLTLNTVALQPPQPPRYQAIVLPAFPRTAPPLSARGPATAMPGN